MDEIALGAPWSEERKIQANKFARDLEDCMLPVASTPLPINMDCQDAYVFWMNAKEGLDLTQAAKATGRNPTDLNGIDVWIAARAGFFKIDMDSESLCTNPLNVYFKVCISSC